MADPIEHVVVLMLENNSFDRMLGCMNAIYPTLEGVDPGDPFTNPDYPNGSSLVSQLPNDLTAIASDPGHDLDDVLRQIGNNDCQGFVADFVQHCPQSKPAEREQIMGYFRLNDLPVLHTLARNFVICDQWFSSVPGPTWPNRFFVHSGTSLGHTDMPEGILHPAVHLYNQPTVFRRLSEQQIRWRIYYGDVPQSLVMTDQLLYPQSYSTMDHFAKDTQQAKSFPQYVFIEPTYFGAGQNDQHPPTDVAHGEILIAQTYNAIRQNEELWQSTLFVILYDEHGGFCDHVPPPATVAPDNNTKTFAFNHFGLRVPALLISPWLDAGVLHTVFDHTSLLRYITDKWRLGPLGARVPQANSFAIAFSRTSGRTDCPASLTLPVARPNDMNVAMNAHQIALAAFTQNLEATATAPSDSTVAAHVRAMAGNYASQSQAVSERVQQFFARASATTMRAPGNPISHE
jgi:phospholipase C